MADFEIIPHTKPEGEDEYLPCDEQHATRWAVVTPRGSSLLFEDRATAEEYVRENSRARRFTWLDGDVEHH